MQYISCLVFKSFADLVLKVKMKGGVEDEKEKKEKGEKKERGIIIRKTEGGSREIERCLCLALNHFIQFRIPAHWMLLMSMVNIFLSS